MARRMRSFDWSQTVLGSPWTWPLNLRTSVRIMLTSRQPMFVWWGEHLINLYNDSYASFLWARHPSALGQPAAAVWPEIWHEIGPRAEFAMHRDEGTYDEALPFILLRKGYPEETYVTFSYSPIPDDRGGFGGILCPVTEETQRIIGERQLALLRDLATRTADARTWRDACLRSATALATDPHDLPFALIYRVDKKTGSATLAAAVPEALTLDMPDRWPLEEALRKRSVCLITDLTGRAEELPRVRGYPVKQAVALPVAATGDTGIEAVLVAGLNPLRLFDEGYQRFMELAAGEISTAISNAESYEAERRRAEALAELDRAKTTFFSNVSHEFRTPLTLTLGLIEEELREQAAPNERLTIAYRNALRLLKLVNMLLDFSRIEAGRIEALYEATDLGALTEELASVFRSAIEKAGLRLLVDCPSLPEDVYIDREMWEKIVLNLLSNAFKFTFEGEITVSLRHFDEHATLSIADTGVGIPAAELPRVFERFHRVRGTRSRTDEGTGIGLALVQELVKLHGGEITAQSAEDRGTTFSVSIPFGTGHLAKERISDARKLASTAWSAMPFLEEALRWLPESQAGPSSNLNGKRLGGAAGPMPAPDDRDRKPDRVLVADDNADMCGYLRHLLAEQYDVIVAPDGEAAFEAACEHQPDLILVDVMMPRLDGCELVERLRAHPQTARVPIILLSARAGEAARVDGLAHGADDYLIKPFSARELLARVNAHLQLAKTRKAFEDAFRRINGELERLVRERTKELEEANEALHKSERTIAADLETTQRLQQVSTQLIGAGNGSALYDQILDAAMATLHADFASIQIFHPERGAEGELRLLGHRGFSALAAASWEWIRPVSNTSCGVALRTWQRAVVPDVEGCEAMAGTEDLEMYRQTGIRAMQTTPLLSRSGALLGVFSTHWREPHELSASELHSLDVLARLVADLIERSQAETRLQQSEKRYHLAVEAAPNGIVVVKPDGEIVLVNSHAGTQFGYSKDELLRKRVEMLFPERFRALHREYLHSFLSQQKAGQTGAARELCGLRKDGSEFPIEIGLSPMVADDETLVLNSIVDITARRQAEETSRLLASVVRSSALGIISLDLNAVITSWNRGAQRLFGYTAEEMIGRPISVLLPHGYADQATMILERAEKGESIEQYETIRRAKNGSHIDVSITWSPIHDANGRVAGASKIVRDITEQKRLEEQRMELIAKERALATERASREAESKLARVVRALSAGELATSIAHEINQPLAGVVLNAEAGLRWLGSEPPNVDEARESLALVARDGNRASAVIRRIRDSLTKETQVTDSLDLNEVVQETVVLARANLEKQRVTIQIELAGDIPRVRGDRIQLQQAILNLLLNGVEAMASVAGARELRVESKTTANAGVVIAVRDSGTGISPQDMPRLFDAFFTTKPDGMGMGLAISRTIIEAHGGRIWAEFNDGPGLTVQFELPAEDAGRAATDLSLFRFS